MKLTTIAIAAALMSATMASTAMADDSTICSGRADLAGEIMKNRQLGADMAKMIELVSKSPISKKVLPFVIAAYEQPRFDSPSYQQKAISDFKNEVMLACIKGVEL